MANIFLLDDPYSALDAHVAKKVHDEVVLGLLAKKTRIVTTNRLEFATGCDFVVVLSKGRIEEGGVGAYADVCRTSPSLKILMAAQFDDDQEPSSGDAGEVGSKLQLQRAVSYDSASGEDTASLQPKEITEAGQKADENEDEEEDEEGRATGGLKKEVVWFYLKNMGGRPAIVLLFSLYSLSELFNLSLPLWLAEWTTAQPEGSDVGFYLTVYVVLGITVIVFQTVRDLVGNLLSFRAAKHLHANMFASVLRATMTFFQDTKQGTIINRFSKDTSEIDKDIIWVMVYTIVPILTVVGNFALVGGLAYFALIGFLPAFWLYYKCWIYYNPAVLDLKRITKVTSSPIYDHFNSLCRENALSVVRAHCQAERQCHYSDGLLTEQQRPEYSMIYVELWYCMCVETLGCVLVFFVSIFAVVARGHLMSASHAAVALTFAGECSDSINSVISQFAEFGMAFNCVERVMEYTTTLIAEAPLLATERPPHDWPAEGVLEVKNLQLRYRPTLPLVLNGISFSTRAGERLGIVGRTGAGKSSLLLALLRIVEPDADSELRLDGWDLLALGLQDLRSAISMIPQDPVLFQASLGYNIDPYGQHNTSVKWKAVQEAQLAPWVCERAAGTSQNSHTTSQVSMDTIADAAPMQSPQANGSPLLHNTSVDDCVPLPSSEEFMQKMLKLEIKEGGQNLSGGQRQMVAIARAVLRKSKLVILDEATAALDSSTDKAIQLAVRRCFQGATTLTIAHRLKTILDSDRILVLAEGEVKEVGSPDDLRAMPGGIFHGMVEEAGLSASA